MREYPVKFNWDLIESRDFVIRFTKLTSSFINYSYWGIKPFINLDGNLPNYSVGIFEEKETK